MLYGRPFLYLVSDAYPLACQKNAVKFELVPNTSRFPSSLCAVRGTYWARVMRKSVNLMTLILKIRIVLKGLGRLGLKI